MKTVFILLDQTSAPWSRGDILNALGIGAVIVIALLTGILGSIIGLFTKSAGLKSDVKHITKDVSEMKADFKDVRQQVDKIPHLEKRMDQLWGRTFSSSQSPLQLNEFGNKILNDSHVDKLLGSFVDIIVQKIKDLKPETAYQAQSMVIDAFKDLKLLPEIKKQIEDAAFNSGVDPDTVLTVAALFFRDRILQKTGFDGNQIAEINTI